MRNCVTVAITTGLILSASPAFAQPVAPELYGELPTVEELAVSPDGKSLAMIQHAGGATGVVIFNLDDLKAAPKGAGLGDAKARSLVWGDNGHVLVLASRTYELSTNKGLKTREMWRWLTINAQTLKPKLIFGNDPGYYNQDPGSLQALPSGMPGKAIFTRWTAAAGATFNTSGPSRMQSDSGWGYSAFEVDLEKASEKQIARGEENTQDWIIAPNGGIAARIDYDPKKELREIRLADGKNYPVTTTIPEQKGLGATISFYGLTADPGKAFATTYGNGGRRSVVAYELSTGKSGEAIFANPQYDVDEVIFDYRKAAADGVKYIDDMPRIYFFAEADRKLQASLEKALPGAKPMIVSRSEDGARMIVRAIYSDHPDQYFYYDRTAKSMNMIAASYPKLDGKVHARKEKFDYVSPDGLTIPGYLTISAGAAKSRMPLIVLPHGGPEGRDDMSFDWWAFFYAARGYAVYQPNFRGSDGYGIAFREAGYGEWGRKMQDDITKGVEKLIADGVVDPARICIVGASYGGYAALAGATLTPNLYKCAVSVNGVSDLAGMIGETARTSDLGEAYWTNRIGSRFRDTKALDAVSPSKIAGQAVAPILILHGVDDTVVPIGQSREMRDALKLAGKPHEYVELKGEDHWLSNTSSRTEMLRRSIEFIDKNIGQ